MARTAASASAAEPNSTFRFSPHSRRSHCAPSIGVATLRAAVQSSKTSHWRRPQNATAREDDDAVAPLEGTGVDSADGLIFGQYAPSAWLERGKGSVHCHQRRLTATTAEPGDSRGKSLSWSHLLSDSRVLDAISPDRCMQLSQRLNVGPAPGEVIAAGCPRPAPTSGTPPRSRRKLPHAADQAAPAVVAAVRVGRPAVHQAVVLVLSSSNHAVTGTGGSRSSPHLSSS